MSADVEATFPCLFMTLEEDRRNVLLARVWKLWVPGNSVASLAEQEVHPIGS